MYAQVIRQRSDTKMYRLQSPQTPLVRTAQHARYCMDEYPSGTNMVVAVLSYTGAAPLCWAKCPASASPDIRTPGMLCHQWCL